ncbi:FHA domain-containing protein, partial [Bifidobacterium sp. 64T4]|nr:FHA domain-containing protein [Bifidobacterium pongonis]
MTELTFALLKYGFLILLWVFAWLAVRSLRKDIESFSPRPSRSRQRRKRRAHQATSSPMPNTVVEPQKPASAGRAPAQNAGPTLLVIIDGPLAG